MRSNYSREERQKIVEEYIQSGKSQTVFAPEYGINPNTLSAWVTKYKSAEACQAADVNFVEFKSTFKKEKQNLIIRKAGIEIESPGNSNTVINREILAAMAS
ncbi:MAG: transposase [Treponema sp.]|nr:transposase [Treponema sp.]